MKVLIAGSNGTIGSALTRHLIAGGIEVVRLVRNNPLPGQIWWDPDAGEIETGALEGFDGVVNLASMPWPLRWSTKVKQQMLASRLSTNGLLARSLAACQKKPNVLICASGMGYYPPSGDTVLTEDSPAGSSFLSSLQQNGECATSPASEAGIRVVHLRIPAVMGGPMLKMIGYQAGNGQQWASWVGRDELASIIEFVLTNASLNGPVNAASPNPLRHAEFARVSTRALDKKPGAVLPELIVRMTMGEMGDELVLASRRLHPAKLLAAGYHFRFPELTQALKHEVQVMQP